MFDNYAFTVAERFIRYVQTDTQSDPQSALSGMALVIVGLIYYYYRRSKKNIHRRLPVLNRFL